MRGSAPASASAAPALQGHLVCGRFLGLRGLEGEGPGLCADSRTVRTIYLGLRGVLVSCNNPSVDICEGPDPRHSHQTFVHTELPAQPGRQGRLQAADALIK